MPINDKTSRVVKMFCSTHPERYQIMDPLIADGYIYATDSFTAIRVPTSLEDEDNVERKYTPESPVGKKFPLDILRDTYAKHVVYEHVIRVKQLDILFESFNKVPVLDYSEQVECTKCHWDWQIECPHCEQDYECPKCNGEWTTGKPKPTWEMEFDQHIYVIIKDTTVVSGSYLLRVREVAKDLNQDTVTIQWVDRKDYIDPIDNNLCWNTAPLFFKVDDAIILVMPLKHKRDPKFNAENIQVVTL